MYVEIEVMEILHGTSYTTPFEFEKFVEERDVFFLGRGVEN